MLLYVYFHYSIWFVLNHHYLQPPSCYKSIVLTKKITSFHCFYKNIVLSKGIRQKENNFLICRDTRSEHNRTSFSLLDCYSSQEIRIQYSNLLIQSIWTQWNMLFLYSTIFFNIHQKSNTKKTASKDASLIYADQSCSLDKGTKDDLSEDQNELSLKIKTLLKM